MSPLEWRAVQQPPASLRSPCRLGGGHTGTAGEGPGLPTALPCSADRCTLSRVLWDPHSAAHGLLLWRKRAHRAQCLGNSVPARRAQT